MGVRAARLLGALALLAGLAGGTEAGAATISFFKGGPGQPAGANVSGFDLNAPAVIPGGFPYFVLGPTPENVLVGFPTPGLFSTASSDQDVTEALAVMVEPGTHNISDLIVLDFGVSGGQGSVIAAFQAFDPALVGPVSGIPFLVENGHTQNLNGSFFGESDARPLALPDGLIILVSPVPEPDGLILLAVGAAGAGLVRYGLRAKNPNSRSRKRACDENATTPNRHPGEEA